MMIYGQMCFSLFWLSIYDQTAVKVNTYTYVHLRLGFVLMCGVNMFHKKIKILNTSRYDFKHTLSVVVLRKVVLQISQQNLSFTSMNPRSLDFQLTDA